MKADFELHDAAELTQALDVLVASEGGGHAGEVCRGGDAGPEPMANVFAGGAAT